jgi:cytochrome c556
MKKRTAAMLVCLAVSLATVATADDQEFVGWMKQTGGTVGKLRKEVEAKAYPDVAKDATALAEIFKNVEDYFAKAHTDDAVAMAQSAQAVAKQLANAAASGDADAVANTMKGVQASCAGCHGAHREKLPEGGYKIK